MLPLVVTILIASLLGSLHCAGMCGGFLAMALAPVDGTPRSPSFFLSAAYNAGRLITYTTLGLIAGAAGQGLDLSGDLVGIERAAAYLAGTVMVLFGLAAIARQFGARVPRAPVPARLREAVGTAYGGVMNLTPPARALSIGMLTTFLPCGWLYAFVVTAAGTGSPSHGALAMAAFWLGTLPIMAALGLGVSSLLGPLRRHLPLATSLLLVFVGGASLFGRVGVLQRQEMIARETSRTSSPMAGFCHPQSEPAAPAVSPSTIATFGAP